MHIHVVMDKNDRDWIFGYLCKALAKFNNSNTITTSDKPIEQCDINFYMPYYFYNVLGRPKIKKSVIMLTHYEIGKNSVYIFKSLVNKEIQVEIIQQKE